MNRVKFNYIEIEIYKDCNVKIKNKISLRIKYACADMNRVKFNYIDI